MALPQLNTATYELELPSTGETVKYRPFLVKEQKLLMIAQESEDEKQIEQAFANIVKECTFGEIDPYKVPLFDIEYINWLSKNSLLSKRLYNTTITICLALNKLELDKKGNEKDEQVFDIQKKHLQVDEDDVEYVDVAEPTSDQQKQIIILWDCLYFALYVIF